MGGKYNVNLTRLQVMFGIGDLADQYNQHVGVVITSVAMNCSLPVTVHHSRRRRSSAIMLQ